MGILSAIASDHKWFKNEDAPKILRPEQRKPIWLDLGDSGISLGYLSAANEAMTLFSRIDSAEEINPVRWSFCDPPELPPATHETVDSGLGYPCDVEILPFVRAISKTSFRTLSSCQEWYSDNFMHSRRRFLWVDHTDSNPHVLLEFCIHIRDFLSSRHEYEDPAKPMGMRPYTCDLIASNTYPNNNMRAAMYWLPEIDSLVLGAINSWIK